MTRLQAQRLMEDLGKNLTPQDYTENIYVSIKKVGTKVFRQCAFYESEGFTFIWTQKEKFLINRKEVGDFVVVPYSHEALVSKHVT